MINPFAYPDVHLVTLSCCIVNALALLVCAGTANSQGIIYNLIFLVFNMTATFILMLSRQERIRTRQKVLDSRRTKLIELTIGKES